MMRETLRKKLRAIKGFSIASCIQQPSFSFPESGESAHVHIDGDKDGWICLSRIEELINFEGALEEVDPSKMLVSDTVWHELSHVSTREIGHGVKWKREMWRLGQSVRG